ncbi:MAG: N-6 DNA methylase [Fibrobacter sp.]|nr:N-6 DNA methylase [Fibrobacter sp.]
MQKTSLAIAFSKKWEYANNEKRESQKFLSDFLDIFGITLVPAEHFEYQVHKNAGERGYIDCLIGGKIAIEMKSRGENLEKAFEQLKEYVQWLPENLIPQILMVCDFETIILDFDKKKIKFKTKDLRKHLDLFNSLSENTKDLHLQAQTEASVKAAEKMVKLHDALKACGYEGHNLEVYLVRLLFCLFAEDTEIFPKYSFLEYVENSQKDGSDLSPKIARLFEILNISNNMREKKANLPPELLNFQYINGGLFAETLPFADFTEKMRSTLIECAKFDWSCISPAIFGAMFQGVMDKEHRREIGAHYTSEENILKLINPLFMDSLRDEFQRVKNSPKKLDEFHNKIAAFKFLDPACGCGNFLIIAYRELRKLELEVLKKKIGKNTQLTLDIMWSLLRVNVGQFYGIEYEEFPCQIAKVGMWLTDHQMNLEVSDLFGCYYARLSLTQSATIEHGNALRIDWENVVPKRELSFIFGNPPFVGNNNLSASQRDDLAPFFPNNKTMDYVTAWYAKAVNYMFNSSIKCAFVSTNSILQGEQVALLWKPLFEKGIYINFGIPTFKWSNEAKGKAAVHCVIIGFSYQKTTPNITPYLFEGDTVFIESRSKPLCDIPKIQKGNQPTDGGNLIIEASEIDDFLKQESLAKNYIKRLVGAQEYINNLKRYCLWLVNCSPTELRKMPLVMERVNRVREMRLASTDKGTQRLAGTPTLFKETYNPETFVIIPSVSSEKREYIPIGFMDKDTIATNLVLIIPNATLYHFGILTSNVHNAWMRTVCGRLKSDYRYSKDIVYNNFPWAITTKEQQTEIEKLAQNILNARAKFPESSLADLYDPLTMPPELLKARRALDSAAMKLYGFKKDMVEAEIVAELMERYQRLVRG